jgi:hypothetical protein
MFFILGSVFLYMLTITPLVGVISAQSWVEAPCTIVSSEVERKHDGDGPTFRIAIQYDYEFGGRTLHGDRYNLMLKSFTSSGRRGKQAVVDAYPAGLKTVCYVDPADSSQAVLYRGLTADMWWGLFPLPFVLVGGGGLLGAALGKLNLSTAHRRGPAEGAALSTELAGATDNDVGDDEDLGDDYEPADDEAAFDGPDEPRVLKPSASPLGTFIGVTIFACVWNGIVSVFLWHLYQDIQRGNWQWCMILFLTPFVLAGLAIIVGSVYSFAALFNPRPTLTLSRARIPLGGTAKVSWTFSGNSGAIRTLRVTLKGRETATYRRGTDTHTDEETFYEEVLAETYDPLEVAEGEAEVRVPDDSMHSFSAGNNQIVWSLHLAGEIPLRPDVKAEFPIDVRPHESFADRNG